MSYGKCTKCIFTADAVESKPLLVCIRIRIVYPCAVAHKSTALAIDLNDLPNTTGLSPYAV